MTNQDLTAPEAVERWHEEIHGMKSGPALFEGQQEYVRYEDYAALSAALEAEKARVADKHETAMKGLSEIMTLEDRAEALDAKLKEAVEALKPFVSAWNIALASGNTAVSRLALIARDETAGVHFMRARAFLASLEGDKP